MQVSAMGDETMHSYYDRRARDYDDWWLGRGLYAAQPRPGWGEEVERLTALLASLQVSVCSKSRGRCWSGRSGRRSVYLVQTGGRLMQARDRFAGV